MNRAAAPLLALLLALPAAAAPGGKEFRGKRYPLPGPPHSALAPRPAPAPKEGVRFAVGAEEIRLFDTDGDGRADGWATGPTEHLMPLGAEVLLGATRLRIASIDLAAGRLLGEAEPANLPAAVVALNRLRTSHGLPPVVLDEARSAACTAHARYLAQNGWTGYSNPHEQSLGPKGATPEGAEAARRSSIAKRPAEEAVRLFWRLHYHRIDLMCPWLERVGLNSDPAGITVIDARADPEGRPEDFEDGPVGRWAEPAIVPADGSIGHPLTAGDERPREPVPGFERRGSPIVAVFRPSTDVEGFVGTLVEEPGNAAVPVLLAAPGEFPHAHGLVPAVPLKPATWYRATLTWNTEGRAQRRAVRFRTEDPPPRGTR